MNVLCGFGSAGGWGLGLSGRGALVDDHNGYDIGPRSDSAWLFVN